MQKTLFHYTTQKGLLGIIGNRSIWFTNIFYLNDSMEFEYTFSMLQDELNKRNVNAIFTFMKDISEYKTILESAKGSFYVFSFSSKDDDLSQWRAYGDDGGGYCIKFDSNETVKINEKNELIRVECLYDVERQRKEINKIIDKTVSCIDELIKNNYQALAETNLREDEKLKEIRSNFVRRLIALALKFKDPAFREESEFRMYIVLDKADKDEFMKLKFRQGEKMLIPYLDLKIPEIDGIMPIKGIIIGPTNHQALSKIAVEGLLRANSMNDCGVKLSNIPYRGKL